MTETTDHTPISLIPTPAAPGPRTTRNPLLSRLALLRRRPSPRVVQLASLSALIANTLIVVTGGAVRLTNSGLGCPTWPECTAGSLVPVPSLGYHGVIEFSNRLLTYAVTAAVAAAIIATMRQRPRRPVLVRLSWALFFGVVAQAIIGGISVRTQLAPGWVAFHFSFSLGMIAVSWLLWTRSREGDAPAELLLRRELLWLGRTLTATVGAVVVAGTLVTGSGPHAGAADAARRLGLNPATITQAHADLVFIVVGLTIALWFALKATDAPKATLRATSDLFLVLAAQAVIGYTQYFTGLPAWLVLLHMTGACLTWIAAWRILTSMRARPETVSP
jgi:cytochrome c oxidase assembly protein subunit 15